MSTEYIRRGRSTLKASQVVIVDELILKSTDGNGAGWDALGGLVCMLREAGELRKWIAAEIGCIV